MQHCQAWVLGRCGQGKMVTQPFSIQPLLTILIIIICKTLCYCPLAVCYREAWSVCGEMSKDIAMQMYVEELERVGGHTCQ